jgi:uncharacterized protein (TIGR03435 family)
MSSTVKKLMLSAIGFAAFSRGALYAQNITGKGTLNLFTASQQQLGLKLQSTKASVDVLFSDHVEKPSAN